MECFSLILENKATSETMKLPFNVLENSTAKKWFHQMICDLKTCRLKDSFRYFGNSKTKEETVDELNTIIDSINYEDRDACLPNVSLGILNQTMCNFLHDYFVKTRCLDSYNGLSQELRDAIEHLNKLIHHYEGLQRGAVPRITCNFEGKQKFSLEEEDYDNFTCDCSFGDIFITYCITGKAYTDVFKDKDDICDNDEIIPQNIFSSDFEVRLGTRPFVLQKEEFFVWLRGRGLDPEDKHLALGRIKVATLASPIGSEIERIVDFQSVKSIEVEAT